MSLEPVQFGDPTPEDRRTGDCRLCQGEPSVCDCKLRYAAEPGRTAYGEIAHRLAPAVEAIEREYGTQGE